MLRVGLTGGLGSGKSTVAAMLAERGAAVVSTDDLARAMMQPGEPLYQAIAERFGPGVVRADGELDRPALARIAFRQGRAEELNAIVHPAVIARQTALAERLAVQSPQTVFVVESALLLQTHHAGEGGWQRRFDRVVVVTAPAELRATRFVDRFAEGSSGRMIEAGEEHRAEAWRRMAQQLPEAEMAARADFVLPNDGSLAALEQEVSRLWSVLAKQTRQHP